MNILSSLVSNVSNQEPSRRESYTGSSESSSQYKTPVKTQKRNAVSADDVVIHQGPVEVQQGSKWNQVWFSLYKNKMVLVSDADTPAEHQREVEFTMDTSVSMIMRNIRSEDKYKGTAFQIQTATGLFQFVCPSNGDMRAWCRALMPTIAEYKKAHRHEEISLATPQDDAENNCYLSRKHTQSVRSKRTMSRMSAQSSAPPAPHFATPKRKAAPSANRSREVQRLEMRLAEMSEELQSTTSKLREVERYRDNIIEGTKTWKKQFIADREQKLQDTQERLTEECESNVKLRKQNTELASELKLSKEAAAELAEVTEDLEMERSRVEHLEADMMVLKDKLKRELAFASVLEADTRALSEKLTQVNGNLNERCQQVSALQAENQELKDRNAYLEEKQECMQREFFFSMALSIKLALAQQGIYSNADVNSLFQQIADVEYRQWHDWLTEKLAQSQLPTVVSTPTPQKSPSKKKRGGIFSLFN